MASITIRNLDDDLKRRLRVRAAEKGHSLEEEAWEILCVALAPAGASKNLGQSIHDRFAALGGVDFLPVQREPGREVGGHE
ncbi:MAG: plasmid stabilization protein [Tabrizicola sp.]|uniref:FitA-like ribbon-helix-helix domain-containing protein n=1 Tax=Tabrizicola sp. TaxID=2005166 RepID=UPI002737779A|nr:plasmid stabilization protein [Tabrizicola sp.]MDP3261779.1 plasmid stabilization protein [Tabrizicola sp.]MDZ4067131.1 plasmid stabilization protein [Tabrizicola sp.]